MRPPRNRYSVRTKKNDIALIEVDKPIPFSDNVFPACLNTNLDDVDLDTKVIVSGWGLVDSTRKLLQLFIFTFHSFFH